MKQSKNLTCNGATINAPSQRVGTKLVSFYPITREGYNTYRGWITPEGENGNDEGYLVEYADGGNRNHPNHKNYISWTPKDVGDAAYKQSGELSFGHALELLKRGHKVARKNWNASGMYVVLMEGYMNGVPANRVTAKAHCISEGTQVKVRPYFTLYTADGDLASWVPSSSDCIAEDWIIVE